MNLIYYWKNLARELVALLEVRTWHALSKQEGAQHEPLRKAVQGKTVLLIRQPEFIRDTSTDFLTCLQ